MPDNLMDSDSDPDIISVISSDISSDTTSDTIAPTNTPSSATPFANIVKRRHRLEEGTPYKSTIVPPPIHGFHNSALDARSIISYSDGSCAWLESYDDQDTVLVLNLRKRR